MSNLITFAKNICSAPSRDLILKSRAFQSVSSKLSTFFLRNTSVFTMRSASSHNFVRLLPLHSISSRTFVTIPGLSLSSCQPKQRLLLHPKELFSEITRTVIKFGLKNGGKKKTVQTVVQRLFRLHNGLWIRRIGGYHKKMHKKSEEHKHILRQHVFVSRSQCIMFDKMVTDRYKKKTYYINDPFEPYHVRNNFDYVIPKSRYRK